MKKRTSMWLDEDVIKDFKRKSKHCGIPYQTLINAYLMGAVGKDIVIDKEVKIVTVRVPKQ